MCKIMLFFIDGSSMTLKTGMIPAFSTLMNIIWTPKAQRILLRKQEETDVEKIMNEFRVHKHCQCISCYREISGKSINHWAPVHCVAQENMHNNYRPDGIFLILLGYNQYALLSLVFSNSTAVIQQYAEHVNRSLCCSCLLSGGVGDIKCCTKQQHIFLREMWLFKTFMVV